MQISKDQKVFEGFYSVDEDNCALAASDLTLECQGQAQEACS